MHIDEMQWFLWDEFDIWMSECTISHWLKREDIRKKRIRFLATERNQFLHNDWIRSVNRGVLGYNLYAVALPDGVDILIIDGNRFSNNNEYNEYL